LNDGYPFQPYASQYQAKGGLYQANEIYASVLLFYFVSWFTGQNTNYIAFQRAP
jgi:hypothetical protein